MTQEQLLSHLQPCGLWDTSCGKVGFTAFLWRAGGGRGLKRLSLLGRSGRGGNCFILGNQKTPNVLWLRFSESLK